MPSVIIDIVSFIIFTSFQILKATWWIFLPVVIFLRIKPLLLFRQRINYVKKWDWIILEIELPREVFKTPKAMENVISGLHGIWSPITSRQKWSQGKLIDQLSLEIVGTDGNMHFYVRCQSNQRNFVEAKIFSQYPDVEIKEVKDYTEELSPDIPNDAYDMWGSDFILTRDWAYPIKTYIEFEDIEEERRMDPMSQIAELITKMEEGEHFWMQLIISPVLTEIAGHSKKIVDELVGRKASQPSKGAFGSLGSVLGEVVGVFLGSEQDNSQQQNKPEQFEVNMQKLTPGERVEIERVEIKASKTSFMTTLRILYIARKDVMHKEHISGIYGVLRQFDSNNSFRPDSNSFPRSSLIFFKKQRNYLRKRRLFLAYRGRFLGFLSKPYVLNIEELATIYHFPGHVVKAPFMPRVITKTGEPPRGLPT